MRGASSVGAQAPPPLVALDGPAPEPLPVRARAEICDAITRARLERLLPEVMAGCDLDMWLVICQEDNPDPLLPLLVPAAQWQPILTILAFVREGDSVRRINIGMLDTHDLYERPWGGREAPDAQWALLRKLVEEHDPRTIAINTGRVQWAAGGLTHNLHQQLCEQLPDRFLARLVSAEPLVTWWAATLLPEEVPWFEHAVNLARHVIADCYSAQVIEPGKTTTDDLKWHYLETTASMGLEMAFTPYYSVIRDKPGYRRPAVIQPGDLVHCDVGLKYLRYHTDHQQLLYVTRGAESGPPPGLVQLLGEANQMQDVYLSSFETGLSGNALLERMLARGRAQGLEPKVYSHSLGYFLHEPGPLIGLPWEQTHNPGRGDVVLRPYQAFTMELCVTRPLPELGGEPFALSIEEDVIYTPAGARVLDDRQQRFYCV